MPMQASAPQGDDYRFGFDIGGTFTDIVVASRSGKVVTGKTLSTPDDIMVGVITGLQEVLQTHGVKPSAIDRVVAGATTVVTNLIIERKGARTGLITTSGFRDVIEIGREWRYDVYDLNAGFPAPLVPAALRKEVRERVDFSGKIATPLREDDVERALRELVADGATSIAVCFLHAFVNPTHERIVRTIAAKVAPSMHLSLSSEILPEIREFERVVTTTLNAYAMPFISSYLLRIEEGLRSVGVDGSLRLMQSNGGVISREYAQVLPLRMLESGPAAGALAAAHIARACGLDEILAFDMGGTTAKVCLITEGKPETTTEFETARAHRFKRGSGFTVRLPAIDLIEIGAGGGSIAHIDQTGLLKVGPRSAGAKPGPACYGLGGKYPTVTDAALVLGFLDREASLSGSVPIRYDAAWAVLDESIAKPLGISTVDAAVGVYRIVCEQMAAAAKIHAVEKGRDLRSYALVAFGGAGPLHAREVARRLGCHKVVVPPNAGVFSAVGLLLAPTKVDAVRSLYKRLDRIVWPEIEALYIEMTQEIANTLESCGVSPESITFQRSADMRFVGQGFEVTAPVPLRLGPTSTTEVAASFKQGYAAKFGRSLDDVEIEVMSWRVEGSAGAGWLGAEREMSTPRHQRKAPKRKVYFIEQGEFVETQVYRPDELAGGSQLLGPALIEQAGSTIVIGPGDRFFMDQHGITHIMLHPVPVES